MLAENKMGTIFISGFLTGMLLQIAIGPVFFFILNLALQRTVADGLLAVMAVTLVDYLFIVLAVLGVGKLLERPRIRVALGGISAMVLVLFGLVMILSISPTEVKNSAHAMFASNFGASFMSAFVLTASSPLTIVFWTSLFAAKAIEKGYQKKELVLFGLAAGFATCVFLGGAVALFSTFRASIPFTLLKISNMAVGAVLIAYGMIRLLKIIGSRLPLRTGRSDLNPKNGS